MARPSPQEDWQFIKSEIKLGLNFLKDYFAGKVSGTKHARVASLLDFGPINGLKLLLAILISGYVWYSLSSYGSGHHWLIALFVFLVLCDLLFEWEVIWPVLKNVFNGIVNFVKGLLENIWNAVQDLNPLKKDQ